MSTKRVSLSRLTVGCLLLTLLHAGGAFSQDEVTAPDDVSGAADSAATVAAYGPPERVIYIPFERFSDVFENPAASVVLPYADYLELWALKSASAEGAGQPVDAVITQAEYVATIERDVARIDAALTVNVVGKPWVEVPLNFGEAAVGAVTSGDGEVLLQGREDGTYAMLFKERGEQQVRLELTARVVTSPDGRQIDLDCPPAAITTFEIRVPQADQEIEVRPRLVQQPVAAGEGETRVSATLGATGHIAAAWRPRATVQPEMQLLVSVTNRQRHHLADGMIHTDAWLTYEVLRGELQQVRIVVPPEHRVLDVAASTKVQGWQTETNDERQTLTVELLNAVDDQVTVEVHTEQRLDEKTVSVGGHQEGETARGIHALGVVRESGQVVVSHGSDLSLRVTEQAGVVRIEPDEVAPEIRQAGALAYKYYSPVFTLTVAVSDVEPRVRAVQLVNLVIGDDELEVFSDLSYTIERAGLFELRVGLPERLVVDDVRSEHLREYRIVDETLVIVLQERTLGNVLLAIEAHQVLNEDVVELTLPVPEPLEVDRETGIVRLFADEAVDVTTNEAALEAARPAPVLPRQTRGRARLRAAWQFTHHPVVIPVAMTRKPARLSATVATDINVEPTRTRVTTLVDFHVEYAGLGRFRVSIPEEALDSLQIEAIATMPTSPSLQESRADDPVEGWVPYTLVMQRDVVGRQRFRIIYDLEPTPVIVPVAGEADERSADDGGEADADEVGAGDADEPGNGDTEVGDDETAENAETRDSATGSADADDTRPAPAVGDSPSTGEGSGANEESNDQSPGEEAGNADQGQDEDTLAADSPAEQVDPNRMRTSIRIIRPMAGGSDGDGESTRLSQVTGEIRLQKERSLTIAVEASGADVEPIDVRELTTLPAAGAFAFWYRKHPSDQVIAVDVTQARYEVQEVVATVVSRALVEVVLGEDLTATYRCRYRMKSTERQRLRVELPKGLEVLSVLVNDSEVRLEPDPAASAGELWDSYFVKVSRSGASDEPFFLTFQFLWIVHPQPFERGLQGTIKLPMPRIGEPAGAAVQQTRVVVWVPEDYALIGDPSGFTLLAPRSSRPSLLRAALLGGESRRNAGSDDGEWVGGESNVLIEFPTTGRVAYRYSNLGGGLELDPTITLLWWNMAWYTVVVSLTLAAIALLLLRTTWENKLGLLLLLSFGGLLLGLKGEQVLAHALSAARFGLLFLLGLWIIEALFGRHHPVKPGEGGEPAGSTGVVSAVPPHVAVVPPPGVFEPHHSQEPHDHDDR